MIDQPYLEVPASVVVLAADGRIRDIDENFARWTGLRREHLAGMDLTALLTGWGIDRAAAASASAVEKPLDGMLTVSRPSARPERVRLRLVPLVGSSGALALFGPVPKEATGADLYRQILDTITDMVLLKGSDSRILWANRAFLDAYGMDNAALRNLVDAPFTPPDVTLAYVKDDLQVFTTGTVLDIPEEPVTWHDGRVRYYHTVKAPIFDAARSVVMTVGVSRDITERRTDASRLRAALRESETLLASISAILVGIGSDQVISRWNQAAQTILGIPAERAIGSAWSDIVLPFDRRVLDAAMAKAIAAGEAVVVDDLAFRGPDGRCGLLMATVTASRGSTGASTPGLVILATDVTERRLLERQRQQGQKMESVGQLAAGIAHEINTPVQFVGDNLRFLRDAFADMSRALEAMGGAMRLSGALPPDVADTIGQAELPYLESEVPKAIDQALEGVERVGEIVRAMKEFSHPGSRETAAADINQAVTTATVVARNEYRYLADLHLRLDQSLPLIPCRIGEVSQVLLNLIVNAAHAIASARRARGIITITTRADGDSVEIRIMDDGTGIDEGIRERVFDPFFTTKEVGKGTGQGLAMAHHVIVQRHGGSISFESTMGVGTTFIIRLPIRA
jgi:PAS domain S-box-containing protein